MDEENILTPEEAVNDKVLRGHELIYFSKKIQDEIASAVNQTSIDQLIEAIQAGYQELNFKLDLILDRLNMDYIDHPIVK